MADPCLSILQRSKVDMLTWYDGLKSKCPRKFVLTDYSMAAYEGLASHLFSETDVVP
jgi:hypothetical protein